ncbi:6-phosphogluconolactonase, partial [Tyzzerella sp. OttesenSCG-928-J15]|nr:6-phosphogluconolactonase [Tyzzerella sp. OttesenSCG-928-J15]
MKIYKAKNYDDLSRKAANIIAAQVILKPNSVLGLATGSSPIGTYKQLIEGYNKGDIDFSEVTTINLDEYCGLSPDNDQSYNYFMRQNLFNHININFDNVYLPDGLAADGGKECAR